MPLVKYNGSNLHVIKLRGDDQFRFLPGINEVPADQWERLLVGSDSVNTMLEQGRLKVIGAPVSISADQDAPTIKRLGDKSPVAKVEKVKEPDSLDAVDVSRMTSGLAIELIDGVVDADHLKRFQKQEESRKAGSRKTVLEALDKQIKIAEVPLGGRNDHPVGSDPTGPSQPPARVRQMLGANT